MAEAAQHQKNGIFVTGYPSYTQSQDLIRVFSDYGPVKVEKINYKFAVLIFTHEDDAKEAIDNSGKVTIYGEFLSVKQHSPSMKEPTTPKREYPKAKRRDDDCLIDPKQLDLSGDFHRQLDAVLSAVRLNQEEVTALSTLYQDIELVLQQTWPGCRAIPFGSITTGLGTKTSDADCFVEVPKKFRHPNANFVNRAKRILQQSPYKFNEIVSIPTANTPIVKFFHVPTKTNCDLTFKTPLGSQNSKLIAFLLHADPRLIPMAVVVKYWAKVHGFTGTGRLTNYALTMLVIFYLQQPPVSVLPAVEWLQRDRANDVMVDFWNTGFMHHHALLPTSTNTSSIAELLGGFFQYYTTFNFEKFIVSPFLGRPVDKEELKDINKLPREFQQYKQNVETYRTPPLKITKLICVQDPFEQCHNVTSAITTRLYADIKAYFAFAAAAYDEAKLDRCTGLLKTILLQRPKLPRGRNRPEFRAVIYPHIIQNIQNPSWTVPIREVMLDIFQKICKIKLTKQVEDPKNVSKKQKERYRGFITKAIWKRKNFAKLCNFMDLSFLEKQIRITEEVLNVEKEEFNVEFQLTLSFSSMPKQAGASIKIIDGEVSDFAEFGKFFVTNMQNWFMTLLKPHLRPLDRRNRQNGAPRDTKPESEEELTIEVTQTEEGDVSPAEDNDEQQIAADDNDEQHNAADDIDEQQNAANDNDEQQNVADVNDDPKNAAHDIGKQQNETQSVPS